MQKKIWLSCLTPFLFTALLLLVGCATKQAYEGPKLPSEGVVLIKPSFGLVTLATIAEVNGKERGFFEERAEVLPGEHTVKIRVSRDTFFGKTIGNKTLTFQAKTGHTYKVDGTISGGDAFAWIVDETNNEVVAGEKR